MLNVYRAAGTVAKKLQALRCEIYAIDVAALSLPARADAFDWLQLHPQATAEQLKDAGTRPDALLTELSQLREIIPPP